MRKKWLMELDPSTRIGQLEQYFELYGYCIKCGRTGKINRYMLASKYGKNALFTDLDKRLLCGHCKIKGYAQFAVSPMPR